MKIENGKRAAGPLTVQPLKSLGLTPAQTRAKGRDLWNPLIAARALTLRALSDRRKGKCWGATVSESVSENGRQQCKILAISPK